MSRDTALLLDIVMAARDAQSFVKGMTWDDFRTSRLHQNAVARSLEIVGEASGKQTTQSGKSTVRLPGARSSACATG